MNKKLIRLTESDLHRIVKETIGKVMNGPSLDDYHYGFNNFSELQGNNRIAALEEILDSTFKDFKQELLRRLS